MESRVVRASRAVRMILMETHHAGFFCQSDLLVIVRGNINVTRVRPRRIAFLRKRDASRYRTVVWGFIVSGWLARLKRTRNAIRAQPTYVARQAPGERWERLSEGVFVISPRRLARPARTPVHTASASPRHRTRTRLAPGSVPRAPPPPKQRGRPKRRARSGQAPRG